MSASPSAPRTPPGRLSDQVAARLQKVILSNELAHGERLPPERELAELLGVSRTAVREGVRSLVAKGLLEVRQGDGTVVRAPDIAMVAEILTLLLRVSGAAVFDSVHEVRRVLEVEIAGLAAQRRSDEDIAALHAGLAELDDAAGDHERWAEADVALHERIAVATHNPLYPVLLDSMAGLLVELRRSAARLPAAPSLARAHHAAIIAAVEAGNRVAARKAMTEHMAEAESTFRRARLVDGLKVID